MVSIIAPAVIVLALLAASVRIINQYENGIIFRLGRFAGTRKPGLNLIIPLVDRLVVVDMRLVARDVPPQDVITRDNVSVKVNAVIYFRVVDAERCIIQVEDFLYATLQLAQTTLRAMLGQHELDDLLSQREKINRQLQIVLDQQTEPWGVKVANVEVKDVELPQEMRRAMSKQAEAERERRAKVIAAEGEFQSSEKLAQASEILGRSPASLQLRYLQTLVEIAAENNSTTIFPVPIDLISAWFKKETTKG